MSATLLGVVADDFTGATDIAAMLVQAGLPTQLAIGVPPDDAPAGEDFGATVVALKTRTVPADEAVAQSLAAWRWLRRRGARQCFFKVCSTFDSTPRGNIGPVAEALLDALGADFSIVCPAFPQNARTVFRGHLFVGDQLLSESGMRDHPLTPMRDANLVRVLQAQSRGRVGLIGHDVVGRGDAAVRERIAALRGDGVRLAIADAIADDDLRTLGAACVGLPLLIGGSGLALGLPAAYEAAGWLQRRTAVAAAPTVGGRAAVLSGSCSTATRAQVQRWLDDGRAAWRLDVRALARGEPLVRRALDWAGTADAPVLVYATATADEVAAVQAELGREHAGALVERCLADIAVGLVGAGVRRLVVAGGETSGAVVHALGVSRLAVGATIEPGVPWTVAEGRPLALALKSGNIGGEDFFAKALACKA
jgi:uncharacterized protein YgbK (DUF1537 family)